MRGSFESKLYFWVVQEIFGISKTINHLRGKIMFINKSSVLDTNQLLAVIKNSHDVLLTAPIPALARERNGKLEYLLIGQKTWQELPSTIVAETKISHIEHFEDSEPLVVVHLTLEAPTTDTEISLTRLLIDSISPKCRKQQGSSKCGCSDKATTASDVHTEARPSCAGCSYCGPCEPGYCYRSCYCNGQQDWCYDRVCGNNCP
jgi:hypothetical protein